MTNVCYVILQTPRILNILPHWAPHQRFFNAIFHMNFKCVLRLLFCVNRLPHVTHSWGLMSVWMSWCFFKLYFNANVFPHKSHLWDFSPLWVSMCLLNFAISRIRDRTQHTKTVAPLGDSLNRHQPARKRLELQFVILLKFVQVNLSMSKLFYRLMVYSHLR